MTTAARLSCVLLGALAPLVAAGVLVGCPSLSGLTRGGPGDAATEGTADAATDALVGCELGASSGLCAPATPAGWTGPVILYEGPVDASVPPCELGYSVVVLDGHGEPSAEPVSCAACTCGSTSCAGSLSTYASSTCSGTACGPPFESTECQDVNAFAQCGGGILGMVVGNGKAVVTLPGCPADGGSLLSMPPAWATSARACGASAAPGSCEGEGLCLPVPPSGFPTAFCVTQAGDVPCPANVYTLKHVDYTDASDTRACSPCTCAPPDASACANVGVSRCEEAGCGNCAVMPPGECLPLAATPFISIVASGSAGTCAPAGGQATGQVAPTGATTFCCTP